MIRVALERENVNDEFVTIAKALKHDGEAVVLDELVLEVETSKTVKEIRSPATGALRMTLREGDEVAATAILFEIDTDAIPLARDGPSAVADGLGFAGESAAGAVQPQIAATGELSHAAQALAKEMGVDIRTLGSGWITCADVRACASRPSGSEPAFPTDPLAAARGKTPYRREKLSVRKRAEARNLLQANSDGTVSTIGIRIAAAASRLVAPPFLFEGGISDLVVFETSRLLHRFPDLNAFYLDGRAAGHYQEVNFGISFDAGRSLKVLALRTADALSLTQVQAGIESLLHLYESNAPIPDDLLTTSTITLSDLSRTSVGFMLPLLNTNQSLILGLTKADTGGFMVYGSFDHKVTEGLRVAQFLEELKIRVESHFRAAAQGIGDPAAVRCHACERSLQDEIDAGRRGLLRMTFADGTEGHLCRICFEGW